MAAVPVHLPFPARDASLASVRLDGSGPTVSRRESCLRAVVTGTDQSPASLAAPEPIEGQPLRCVLVWSSRQDYRGRGRPAGPGVYSVPERITAMVILLDRPVLADLGPAFVPHVPVHLPHQLQGTPSR